MSIAKSLPAMIVALAVATAVVTGGVAYVQTSHLLKAAAEQNLTALLETREQSMYAYLDDVANDLDLHRTNPWMLRALADFKTAWPLLGENPTEALQDLYVYSNRQIVDVQTAQNAPNETEPNETEPNETEPNETENGSAYAAVHSSFHPSVHRFLRSRGLHDVYLFDTFGNLIYSVFKEEDFATNLDTGPLADTGLGRAFREARDNPSADFIAFEDFSPYGANYGLPAGFMAAPMLEANGALLGVLAYRLPVDRLNAIMQVNAGMGTSGETYIVGSDLLMRSDSRFSETSTILETQVDTHPVQLALAGEAGVMLTPDYRGVKVFSAYDHMDFLGVRWAVLAEMDQAEVLDPLRSLRISLFWVVIITAFVISTIGAGLAIRIAKPLMEMKDAVLRLANDDLSVVIPAADTTDEVGEMRRALNIFRENAMRRIGAEMRIRHLANHDELTGLPTRRLARDRLKTALLSAKRHGTRVAVMFIDLDGFKAVNDEFGHDGGDELLRQVGARLKSCLRESDTVARIGGDEFLTIVNEFHDVKVATWVVQKLMVSLDAPIVIGGKEAHIGASIGVALYPDHGEDVDDLIKSADRAMYEVKNQGKNGFRMAG